MAHRLAVAFDPCGPVLMSVDTLEYVKDLKAAGIDRKQAEAHVHANARRAAPQNAQYG
jgi:hypothetical protein